MVYHRFGGRAGRNPLFVLGSIHLIGVPASPADVTDAYYPFHHVAWHVSPSTSLLNVSVSRPNSGQGIFSAPMLGFSSNPHGSRFRMVSGVSSSLRSKATHRLASQETSINADYQRLCRFKLDGFIWEMVESIHP